MFHVQISSKSLTYSNFVTNRSFVRSRGVCCAADLRQSLNNIYLLCLSVYPMIMLSTNFWTLCVRRYRDIETCYFWDLVIPMSTEKLIKLIVNWTRRKRKWIICIKTLSQRTFILLPCLWSTTTTPSFLHLWDTTMLLVHSLIFLKCNWEKTGKWSWTSLEKLRLGWTEKHFFIFPLSRVRFSSRSLEEI